MTPPVIACFPVWLYAKFARARYVIDAHSGALLDPRWRSTLFLHRFFSRRAVTTILTNEYLQGLLSGSGGRTMIVTDVPVCFPDPVQLILRGDYRMTLVNTFTRDEPLDIFLRAAALLPEIQFYVTGPLSGLTQAILKIKPENVEFTGFLPDAEYVGLVLGSDAIICLTTLPHTMQRGAYEAVYLGKPVVLSNTELLRTAFDKGGVHVDNTVQAIVKGVRQMKEHLRKYQQEIQILRLEKLEKWNAVEAELRGLCLERGTEPSSTGLNSTEIMQSRR
jgi:glycosyltransferase involved in cell wall biosynthesis